MLITKREVLDQYKTNLSHLSSIIPNVVCELMRYLMEVRVGKGFHCCIIVLSGSKVYIFTSITRIEIFCPPALYQQGISCWPR